MTAGDAALTQVEEPIMNIGAKDISIEALIEMVLTVEPVLKAHRKLLQFAILKILW